MRIASLLIFCALALAFVPPSPADESVLGASPAEIVARFGVPHETSTGPAALTFGYRDANGALGRFVFHEDVAVMVPDDGFTPANIRRPGTAPFNGQRVESAIAALGNPVEFAVGPGTVILKYEGGREVTMCNGRVFGVDP